MNIFKKHRKNILVLGSNGMLGFEVFEHFLKQSQSKFSDIGTVIGLDLKDGYDFTQRKELAYYFLGSIHFDYCINCIAHTNTSAAEEYGPEFDMSYKLNALLPKFIAESCVYYKTKLIHISTDYVFSEKSALNATPTTMFRTGDATVYNEFPCNVYGMHKLIGELFIKEQFANFKSTDYAILRTSWLYGMHNSKSFIHKFLKNVKNLVSSLAIFDADTKFEMTSNEFSIPTSCNFVVNCINETIYNKRSGILHAVPYSPGGISRWTFAKKILLAFPEGTKIDGYNTIDLVNNLKGIERDSYQPKYSQMSTSFPEFSDGWFADLQAFILKNRNELI